MAARAQVAEGPEWRGAGGGEQAASRRRADGEQAASGRRAGGEQAASRRRAGGEQAASRRRADGLLGAQGHYRRENGHFSWQFRDENHATQREGRSFAVPDGR